MDYEMHRLSKKRWFCKHWKIQVPSGVTKHGCEVPEMEVSMGTSTNSIEMFHWTMITQGYHIKSHGRLSSTPGPTQPHPPCPILDVGDQLVVGAMSQLAICQSHGHLARSWGEGGAPKDISANNRFSCCWWKKVWSLGYRCCWWSKMIKRFLFTNNISMIQPSIHVVDPLATQNGNGNAPPILMDRCSHSGYWRSDMGVVGRSLFQAVTTWVGCPVFESSWHLSTRYLPDFKSRFLQVPRISLVQNARACLQRHWHLKQCHGLVQKHDNTPIIILNPIRKQNHL